MSITYTPEELQEAIEWVRKAQNTSVLPAYSWARAAKMFLTEVERLQAAIKAAAERAYIDDVLETCMKDHWIGEGKEYADKQDWIDSWLCDFLDVEVEK